MATLHKYNKLKINAKDYFQLRKKISASGNKMSKRKSLEFIPTKRLMEFFCFQMAVHNYFSEGVMLSKIINTAEKECIGEINSIIKTDHLFAADENPIEIFAHIKNKLLQQKEACR